MSKIRSNIPVLDGELTLPREGDLHAFIIFTQLRQDGPFIYAGYLDAPDPEMAVSLAIEHYGRDQACTGLMALERDHVAGADPDGALPEHADSGPPAEFSVFVQTGRGEQHRSADPVRAATLRAAHAEACSHHPEATSVWTVHPDHLLRTAPDALIWPLSDQSYRLARGYSKEVRAKWEQIRKQRDLADYERDDLKETF